MGRHFTTITDLAAAVREGRPDVAAAGVSITDAHVLSARHEIGVRYEDITSEHYDRIAARAVELALSDAE